MTAVTVTTTALPVPPEGWTADDLPFAVRIVPADIVR